MGKNREPSSDSSDASFEHIRARNIMRKPIFMTQKPIQKQSAAARPIASQNSNGTVMPGTALYTRTFQKSEKTGRNNQVLKCNFCHKVFEKKCNVVDHLRSHSGLKPYSCKHCGQLFTVLGNRDRH